MTLEIHKPELVQRVSAYIRTGQFTNTEELIEKALDALEAKTSAPKSTTAECRRAAGRKSSFGADPLAVLNPWEHL